MTRKQEAALLIDHSWHHAVNDQSKLDRVLAIAISKNNGGGECGSDDETASAGIVEIVEAIEADIIYSEAKSQAVMGHPPSTDGELTLASFLEQLRRSNFQHGNDDGIGQCPVLKLDFKSMIALQSSLPIVESYLANYLPSSLHGRVWINADILSGPGEDPDDAAAQERVRPKFDAAQFLREVTSQLPGTVLSIGWTTSLTDIYAAYTEAMVDEMVRLAASTHSIVTFPVRASCFRRSWGALRELYKTNDRWTITLWWSAEELLSREEFDWIYDTLENGDEELRNRTYYDLNGFKDYLLTKGCR